MATPAYQAGAFNRGAALGNERAFVDIGGAENVWMFSRDFTGGIYNTNTATASATLAAANLSGGVAVVLNLTGALAGAANATLPTVASLVTALGQVAAGTAYRIRVINSSSGAFAWTVVTNTGWTLAGTMSIAQNTWREFLITFQSATAATLQQIGTGTNS